MPSVASYSPVITLKNVVLPAPFGPIRLTTELGGMVNETSLTAIRPPNLMVMWSAYRTLSTAGSPRRPGTSGFGGGGHPVRLVASPIVVGVAHDVLSCSVNHRVHLGADAAISASALGVAGLRRPRISVLGLGDVGAQRLHLGAVRRVHQRLGAFLGYQALAAEQHHQHQQHAEDDVVVARQACRPARCRTSRRSGRRSGSARCCSARTAGTRRHHAPDVAHPAEHHHQQHQHGLAEVEARRRDRRR